MVALATLALPACHAGVGVGPATPTAGDFLVVERAETGPITALAAKAPYLWAAGAPGLRRWDVTQRRLRGGRRRRREGDARAHRDRRRRRGERLGRQRRRDRALGRRQGWQGSGEPRYQTAGSPGDVVALAPRRPVKTKGVWAGGPGGLFHYDGHRWAIVDGLRDAAVSWLGLDDDGVTAWVGTRGRGLYRADDRGATPAPGGAAVGCEQILGMATTAAGTRVVAGNVNGDARLYALTLAGTVELHAPIGIHAVALVEKGNEAVLVAGPVGQRAGLCAARPRSRRAGPLGRPAVLGGGDRDRALGRRARRAGASARGHRRRGGRDRPLRRQHRARRGARRGGAPASSRRLRAGRRRRSVHRRLPRARPLPGRHRRAERLADRRRSLPEGQRRRGEGGDRAGGRRRPPGEHCSPSPPSRRFKGLVDHQARGGEQRLDGGGARRRCSCRRGRRPRLRSRRSHRRARSGSACGLAGGSGDDVGYGAVEIDLQTGLSVQHRPRSAGETAPIEALPLPADLNGVLFDGGATWFASLSGVARFQQGQLVDLGRGRGSRQRALLERGPRRRRRDLGGDLGGDRALRRQELAPGGGGQGGGARPRHRRRRVVVGGDRQGAADRRDSARAPPISTARRW